MTDVSIHTALCVSFIFLLRSIKFLLIFTDVIYYFPWICLFPLSLCCCFFVSPVHTLPSEVFPSFLASPVPHFASPPLFFSSHCIFSRFPTVEVSLHPSDSHFLWSPSGFPCSCSHAQLSCLRSRRCSRRSPVFALQPGLTHLRPARLRRGCAGHNEALRWVVQTSGL